MCVSACPTNTLNTPAPTTSTCSVWYSCCTLQAARNTTSSSSTTRLSQLPLALLARILQHVSQSDLFENATLVGSDWAKAAALSILHLQVDVRAATAPALEAWLRKYGRQLETLQLKHSRRSAPALLIQLPWAQLAGLQSLVLENLQLPPVPNAASALNTSAIPATPFPALKSLDLQCCALASTDCLLRLARSTQLTSLVVKSTQYQRDHALHSGTTAGSAATATDQTGPLAVVCQLLPRLPGLRVLQCTLSGTESLSHTLIKHVGAMHQLHDLQLSFGVGDFAGCFEHLPSSSLTRVFLCGDQRVVEGYALSAQGGPCGLPLPPPKPQQLSNLQQLQLWHCRLVPAALASMSQLRSLQLENCVLLPCKSQVAVPGPSRAVQTPEAVAAFLSAVQGLTLLKRLSLFYCSLDTDEPLTNQQLQQFSALTASTLLEELKLSVPMGELPVPPGCVKFMFPAGKRFPQLTDLSITADRFGDGCMSWKELARIIAVCPALEVLDIASALHEGANLSALARLPGTLDSLTVGGWAFGDQAAPIVARLTQLSEFAWEFSPLSDRGVQQLTALPRLQELRVIGCWHLSEAFEGSGDGVNESADDNDDDQHMELFAKDKVRISGAGRAMHVPFERLCQSGD